MIEMKSENLSWKSIPTSGPDFKMNIKQEGSSRNGEPCGSVVKPEVKPFEQSLSRSGVDMVRSVAEKIPERSQSYSSENHHQWRVS